MSSAAGIEESSTPSSLTAMLKQHQVEQKRQRDDIERKKKLAVRSIDEATVGLVDSVNQGVARVFLNQRDIEEEAARLQKLAKQFAKQTGEWTGTLEKFNNAMKELGDVSLWAASLESEMQQIYAALTEVHKDKSGGSTTRTTGGEQGEAPTDAVESQPTATTEPPPT